MTMLGEDVMDAAVVKKVLNHFEMIRVSDGMLCIKPNLETYIVYTNDNESFYMSFHECGHFYKQEIIEHYLKMCLED